MTGLKKALEQHKILTIMYFVILTNSIAVEVLLVSSNIMHWSIKCDLTMLIGNVLCVF